jgi:YgiT-type zinc finger domain-containing protein
MSARCHHCGHEGLETDTMQYRHCQGEHLLKIKGVLCLRCVHCGEPYLDITLKTKESCSS